VLDELVAFLKARMDEDEAAAKAARRVQTEWYVACDDDTVTIDSLREHIGRLSPARVLREVEAGRNILARYEDCLVRMEDPAYSGTAEYVQIREYEDFVLPNLAAIWNDHPGYDEDWAP